MRCLIFLSNRLMAYCSRNLVCSPSMNFGQLGSSAMSPRVSASYSTKTQMADLELKLDDIASKSLSKSHLSNNQSSISKCDALSVDWQPILSKIDQVLKEVFPKYMDTKTIDLYKYMTQDIVYEDQVFGYGSKGADNLILHMARVKIYFWSKSPLNNVEHCGSIVHQEGNYFFGGSYITVFYRLNSLRSGGINALNPLRWFSKKANVDKAYVLDAAMDFYVNSAGLIYRIVHRKMSAEETDDRQKMLNGRKSESQDLKVQKV